MGTVRSVEVIAGETARRDKLNAGGETQQSSPERGFYTFTIVTTANQAGTPQMEIELVRLDGILDFKMIHMISLAPIATDTPAIPGTWLCFLSQESDNIVHTK